MLPIYVMAFEFLIVILFGVFFRLETSTLTNSSSFTGNLVFLAGTELLYLQDLLFWVPQGESYHGALLEIS